MRKGWPFGSTVLRELQVGGGAFMCKQLPANAPGIPLELGAGAGDLSLTIHPHPTLAETLGLAAEVAEGTITDMLVKTSSVSTRKG